MKCNSKNKYIEQSNNINMMSYPLFFDKLVKLESIASKSFQNLQKQFKNKCCRPTIFYNIGNIWWYNNITHLVNSHSLYPSTYFINFVLNTLVNGSYIVNPPLELCENSIDTFCYVKFDKNKLLIIDALMSSGSYPRYENNNSRILTNKYIYSEHSGTITIEDNCIRSINVSADTNRINYNDETIFLPNNNSDFENHTILFHTHPNTITTGGRIKQGIIYEFPSSSDILNFVYYHNNAIAQLSLVISPEGIYVIRPLKQTTLINIDNDKFINLEKVISGIENKVIAINKNENLTDPDIFHTKISNNFHYIRKLNHFLSSSNIFIEYYPRQKVNNEWLLPSVSLQYCK